VRIGPASMLPPGSLAQVLVDGRAVVVCNVGGTIYALDGVCPHAGGPLGHGALHDHWLVCPFHAWEFDCRTGENVRDPACRLERFAVRVVDGQIEVDLHARTA
jgi:nitrite reductase/ring-hydroxylating ferredoxin subunit